MQDIWVLLAAGLLSGVLTGFLGIGGGTILVPIMVQLGFVPVVAVATSSLTIVVISLSGSIQNWRMGFLSPRKVALLGLPALTTAQLGVVLANAFPDYGLLFAFGLLLIVNVYLVGLRKRVVAQGPRIDHIQSSIQSSANESEVTTQGESPPSQDMSPSVARLLTGGSAGFLAGLFGVGGGVIMVPLQILLLGEKIKSAVQTSLGVIVITALSACVGHALRGNVRFDAGLMLGLGGLLGAQISTRFLPKLPDRLVSRLFRGMLGLLAIYILGQAWAAYQAG